MDEAELQERKKRTQLLIAGGAASLLLPLAGVLYMHWTDIASTASGPASDRGDVFEHRDGVRIVPTQAVANVAPQGIVTKGTAGPSSLDFVAGGSDYKAQPAPAAAAPVSTAAAAAVSAAAAASGQAVPAPPPPAAAPAASAAKPFVTPKLRPTKGFGNFKGGMGAPAAQPPAAPGGAAPGADIQSVLKGLPPGAQNDPRIQQLMQQQQQGQSQSH